jgi:hypothetical protein
VFRDGKSIFFITNNINQFTMLSEAGHRSTILILGSSSSFCPPTAAASISPKASGKVDKFGQKWLGNLAEFLCYDFPPLTSTPTPPFIG